MLGEAYRSSLWLTAVSEVKKSGSFTRSYSIPKGIWRVAFFRSRCSKCIMITSSRATTSWMWVATRGTSGVCLVN